MGENLSVTDGITVSATLTSEDPELHMYNIFIQQHEVQDFQDKHTEYANVQPAKVLLTLLIL